jgi:light-harvesting complex I chlorophyll a/b binding protein 1
MRTVFAAGFLLAHASSNFYAAPAAAPSAYAYAAATPLAPYEQMQSVNAVPYAQSMQPVTYVEQGADSMSTYAVAGALLVGVGAVVVARSKTGAVAAPETESAKNAALIATLAVSGRMASPQYSRAAAPQMFFSGDPDKFDPRQNFRGGTQTKSLLSTGTAVKKVKSKAAVSTKRTGSTFIDVTGRAYQDVSSAALAPKFDEVGVLPPLGRWDPLQIREQGPERYRRFVEMEIKHGRLAMAGFLGVLTTYSGVRFPGYLSTAENIKFSDIPGGAISSWAALPTAAWFQIVLFISFCEINFLKQDPNKEPGDVVPPGIPWARYPDGYDVWLGDGSTKQVAEDELILGRTWKLNAERNNGRAAMMGMTGLIIHEALTGNPFFPIGEQL